MVDFCPRGWIFIYGYCHKFESQDALDFVSARKACLRMGADLITLENRGILQHLKENIRITPWAKSYAQGFVSLTVFLLTNDVLLNVLYWLV